jgi:hypothetical protein
VTLTHNGRHNFIVWTYDASDNRRSLLVNKIGVYKGTSKWDRRAASLEIKADGAWIISVGK